MARSFSRGPRRKTQWAGFGTPAGGATLPQLVDLVPGTAAILSSNMVVSGAVGLLDEEVTITRVIGNVFLGMRISTAEADVTFAVGLAVVRAEALAAGVASLPSPESDPDFEWLYYSQVLGQNPPAGTGAADNDVWQINMPFDVRSQRIVRSGQTPVWIVECETSNAIAGVGGRYLVKLT